MILLVAAARDGLKEEPLVVTAAAAVRDGLDEELVLVAAARGGLNEDLTRPLVAAPLLEG